MLIPFNLWRAEWLKTTRQPFSQIALLIPIAFVIGTFSIGIVAAIMDPNRFRSQIEQVLPFPQCLTSIAQTAAIVGQLIASVFVAQQVGHEYTRDTWKMILPRHGTRVAFLISKIGIAMLLLLFMLIGMTAIGVSLSWVGSQLIDLAPATDANERWIGVAVTLLPMLLYGSVSAFVTIATRSTIAGAMLSFFGLQTVALLSPLYGPLAIVMPYPHLPNIIERWVFRDTEIVNQITRDFGYPVSPIVSAGVILAYCILAILAACVLFQRRDMAGE